MKALNIFGYFAGSLGYNNISRVMAESMIGRVENLEMVEYTEKLPPPKSIESYFHKAADPHAPSISVTYGNDMSKFCGSPRYGCTQWESSMFPPDWGKSMNKLDGVLCNTHFMETVVKESGITVDNKYIGFAVDSIFNPAAPKFKDLDTGNFKFLSVGKWEEHKGFDILLKAFTHTFSPKDSVELILSCFNPFVEGVTNENWSNYLLTEMYKLGVPFEYIKRGKIKVLNYLASATMPSLYTSCDAFVLPTRGEGICLPAVEAMSCGLPAIVTNWSGPKDFLTTDNSYPLNDFELVPARGMYSYDSRNMWADPDIEELSYTMKKLTENPEEGKIKGKNATEYMVKHFDKQTLAMNIEKAVSQ
jgi:glycosyltransferase involved in cell wall biosynthesis